MNETCPHTAVLSDYLAGRVTDPLAREVEGHLRGCRPCQQALVRSTPGSDSLLQAVRTKPSGNPGQSDPELAVALKMIGTLHAATTQPGAAKDAAADTGRLISNYELQKKLGEGGMGAVYLARHLRLKKAVAIKLLKGDRSRDDGAIARFQVEIEAVGKLEHPHIVRALDAGEDKGTHFLVMEYLAGIDLARLIRGLGPIGLADACELIRQAALGLHHAHENNVIHRDVKPSNMMLLAGGKVKVLDLGLAHFRPDWSESAGLTGDHQVLGTLLYVAPEQLAPGSKVDARSDIFSLGVTLIEVLLGRVPPKQGFALVLSDHERSARTDVPPDIWQLAARMTALEPADRPASMLAVAEALRPWCVGANLVQLLARLAGRTTFVDPRLLDGGLAPQVAATPKPGSGSDDDAALFEVVPPPITASMSSAVPAQPAPWSGESSVPNRHENRRWLLTGAGSLAAGSLFAVLLLVGYPLVRNGWQGNSFPEPAPQPNPRSKPSESAVVTPSATGNVEVKLPGQIYAELIRGILDQRKVVAIAKGSDQQQVLHIGLNDGLPAGTYTLQGRGDDWEIEPESFTITPGQTTDVIPLVRFATPWKYPRLPEPGQQVVYSGSLTRNLLPGAAPAGPPRPTPFGLTISTLEDEAVGGAAHRWLRLELNHKLHDYRETAYLLVNLSAYRNESRLIIAKGWTEATSKQIAAVLARRLPDSPGAALTAEFRPERDGLLDAAEKISAHLPADRIGLHVPLVLLFGADCDAAEAVIRSARALLPAPTQFELSPMNTDRRVFRGLVVRAEETLPARTPEAEPLRIDLVVKRSETIPFSFVEIHLSSPALAAELKVDAHTDLDAPLADVPAPPVESLAAASKHIAELEGEPGALDIATLPRNDGEGVSFTGVLTGAKGVSFGFDAQLRVLGTEAIDGAPHRWLNVEVTTRHAGSEHHEEAMLLIDEQQFRRDGKLVAPRGWFLTGTHWVPFTTTETAPIERIEEDLSFLGAPLPMQRLGVHDVLALISKTPLQSGFGDLRAGFAHWRSLHDLVPRPVHVAEFAYGTAGQHVAADVWTVGEKGGVPSYEIVRSHEIPFDFVKVVIISPTTMAFTATVTEVIRLSEDELAKHTLLNAEAFSARVAEHDTKVKAARLAQPNWRLWNINTPAGPVRLWAEYGGKAAGTVLLRGPGEPIQEYSEAALVDANDRDTMVAGRWWNNLEGRPFFRGNLTAFRKLQKNQIYLTFDDEVQRSLTRFHKLDDQPLLQRLMEISERATGATRGIRGR